MRALAALALALGLALGIGGYTFVYAHGAAYLTDDPAACDDSTGFHAPPAAARILGESIDFTRQGQLALREARPR